MLQDIKRLHGKTVSATDGDVGWVKDFYFDDKAWALRYVAMEAGPWLAGRTVLLARAAFENQSFGRSNPDTSILRLNLARRQIEDSPPLGAHGPLSRAYEEKLHRCFGWPAYWQDDGFADGAPAPALNPKMTPEHLRRHGPGPRNDVRLRSTTAVTDYHIQTDDGPIGSVSSFVVETRTWAILELVVETGHRYTGKQILLLPENIERINHEASKVFVNLSKEDIRLTMSNDVAQAGAGYR